MVLLRRCGGALRPVCRPSAPLRCCQPPAGLGLRSLWSGSLRSGSLRGGGLRGSGQRGRGHASSASAGGAAPPATLALTAPSGRLQVGAWVMGCGATVFGMVVLGGVTRLTHSGLSMTEWRLQGTRYPSSAEEWEVEFAKYRASPEFYMLRPTMTLEEFKPIFFYEWAHRMLGRALGVVFAVPAVYFGARGYIRRPLVPRLALLFTMGGMQGLVGWWMVRSGLEIPSAEQGGGYGGYDIPRVSPYRLASHLSTAFAIYAGIVWTGLTVLQEAPRLAAPSVSAEQLAAALRIRRLALPLGALVAVTAVSGAFVAGMQAGHHFNTFPLMDGRLVPEGYGAEMQPLWRNFFEHIPTVQFDHRLLATSTALGVVALWGAAMRQGPALPAFVRHRLHAMLAATGVQFTRESSSGQPQPSRLTLAVAAHSRGRDAAVGRAGPPRLRAPDGRADVVHRRAFRAARAAGAAGRGGRAWRRAQSGQNDDCSACIINLIFIASLQEPRDLQHAVRGSDCRLADGRRCRDRWVDGLARGGHHRGREPDLAARNQLLHGRLGLLVIVPVAQAARVSADAAYSEGVSLHEGPERGRGVQAERRILAQQRAAECRQHLWVGEEVGLVGPCRATTNSRGR